MFGEKAWAVKNTIQIANHQTISKNTLKACSKKLSAVFMELGKNVGVVDVVHIVILLDQPCIP